jgi:NADH:ubiquinone oxidoreductase subunit 3 (subunit A)
MTATVKRFLRYFGIGLLVFAVLFVAASLSYYLPSTIKARVTGTEVKRIDVDSKKDGTRTRDVRFVVTREIESDRTRVFRNEDTGWGWPPYFKFNSGDIMGDAVNLEQNESDVVLVTYYGWRLTFMDLYPNVLSLRKVAPDYRHVPVFNIVIVTLLVGFAGYVYVRIRRFQRARRKKSEAPAEPA